MTVVIPPGQLRYARVVNSGESEEAASADNGTSSSTTGKNVQYTSSRIQDIELKILSVDGRIELDSYIYHAWRYFRCQRNNQDLGSLYDIRLEHYQNTLSS